VSYRFTTHDGNGLQKKSKIKQQHVFYYQASYDRLEIKLAENQRKTHKEKMMEGVDKKT
jgi:hypothetical protein